MEMEFSMKTIQTERPLPERLYVRFTDESRFMFSGEVGGDDEIVDLKISAANAYRDNLISEYRKTSRTPEMPFDKFKVEVFREIERRKIKGGLNPKLADIDIAHLHTLRLHVFHDGRRSGEWVSIWQYKGSPWERCRQGWSHAQGIDEFVGGFMNEFEKMEEGKND